MHDYIRLHTECRIYIHKDVQLSHLPKNGYN